MEAKKKIQRWIEKHSFFSFHDNVVEVAVTGCFFECLFLILNQVIFPEIKGLSFKNGSTTTILTSTNFQRAAGNSEKTKNCR